MPALVQSQKDVLSNFIFGIRTDRATATLPQTTASAIFNVKGGRVIVHALVGEVTTAIQNQANNTKIIANPTTGSDVDMCTVVDVANLEVGGKLALPAAVGTALTKALAGQVTMGLNAACVAVGTIDLSCAASNTGSVKWSCWWSPFDDGAYVEAA